MVALVIDYDANARLYLASLQAGQRPDIRPDCGRWSGLVSELENIFEKTNGSGAAVQQALVPLKKKHPDFAELFSSHELPPEIEIKPEEICPPLPDFARLPENLSAGASPLMDLYIDYSKKVSPEGFEHFHEAGFVSMLSTINARRPKINLKKKDYCSLMVMFVADSTDFAKTTTANAAENVLMASGLHWLLGSGKTTPQRLVYEMSGIVPEDYSSLSA